MAPNNLKKCLEFTYTEEGGYQANPKDRGNWYHAKLVGTNRGIIAQDLVDYFGVDEVHLITPAYMKTLPTSISDVVYASLYWNTIHGDGIPVGVDLAVFDFAVNAGKGTSAKVLQRCLGFSAGEVDGYIGPVTLRAVTGTNSPTALLDSLYARQCDYYEGLEDFPEFGADWLGRTERRCDTSKKMLYSR